MKRLAVLMVALAVPAGTALADTPVSRSIPFSGGTVSMEMIAGDLTIEGHGGGSVEITGVLRSRCEELEVGTNDEGVSIEVEWTCDGDSRMSDASELTLRVPRGARLLVETISAGVRIGGIEGEIDAETISGTLDVSTEAARIDLATVSGTIRLTAHRSLAELDMESVSGGLEADIDPGPGSSIDIESVSGSVTLSLPADVSAGFDITTFSGDIRNDFGPPATRTSKYLPSKELSFSLGGGSADISIETLSGRIVLKRR